jgi:glycosyltransferase involved in cell wall biosynthesis
MFSIEMLFDNIAARVSANPLFSVTRKEMPTENNFILNTLFALRNRGGINHITGDIHYIALVLGKRNTVLTIHDCVFLTRYSRKQFKYWFIRFFWYQLPIWASGAVTVISEKTKRELIMLTGVKPDKFRVIPNFYDPRFSYIPKAFNKVRPRILQIGTKSNKNINKLIEALKFIPCELHTVGVLEEDTLLLLK